MELRSYIEKIVDPQDQILFQEAFQSFCSQAYRSAYIMFWLTCAESLKHKFQMCSKSGDKRARVIYQKITNAEGRHKAVDKSILTYSQQYGLITDLEYKKLEYIYNMRCIYAHPYKESPTKEDVISAIDTIMRTVLARPALLTETFVEELISKLTNNECYLSDVEDVVRKTAKKWLEKIHPNYHKIFFEIYTEKYETMCTEQLDQVYIRRARWILDEILKKISFITYNGEEWHNLVSTYPQTILDILQVEPSGLMQIGDRAKDYVINTILKNAKESPEYLNILIPYLKNQEFLGHNYSIINNSLLQLPLASLQCTQLPIDTYLPVIINALQSGNFERQNEASNWIYKNRNLIVTLSSKQQFDLGKNLHEAAIHGAFTAQSDTNIIANQPTEYPFAFIQGLVHAVIVLDSQGKCSNIHWGQLELLSKLFKNLPEDQGLIENLNKSIQEYFNQEFFAGYKESLIKQYDLNQYDWLKI